MPDVIFELELAGLGISAPESYPAEHIDIPAEEKTKRRTELPKAITKASCIMLEGIPSGLGRIQEQNLGIGGLRSDQ